MTRLHDILLDTSRRQNVVDACVELVDSEVAAKGGIGGLTVKGGYAIVKKVKPVFVRDAVDKLLDAFVEQLEPFYADFLKAGGGDLQAYLQRRAGEVANALLGVTDARAARVDNRSVKAVYEKLRPTGMKHVEASVPGIARILATHT